ncbi:MAG TPA: TIGR03619 family F420-dependent LLM class oxidoreductase [Pseudonocardiaceae bacterium]|jgi:probable F420-dependent oxidoreductase|nr:TIGR03619 family F420-dependent LLM class oxidoreductase [Pseudonocardiaceae bacterium]
MKLALFGLHRDSNATEPDALVRRAILAEDAGFESLWVGDHILLPPGVDEAPRLETVTALTYLAAVTSRVRLAAGVIVLPQRQPVLLAKQLGSIDVLSRGRLTVGIGVGYIEAELTALGASLADRAARTDEYLAALRALWDAGPADFHGEFVEFAGRQRPLPVQPGGPPIVVGGMSRSAHRRAVQHGNGWYGWQLDPEETEKAIAALRETAERHPRPAELGDLEITITPPGVLDLDTARRYAEAGVHRLCVHPTDTEPDTMERLIHSVGDTLVGRI